ncbi:MAG: sporulation protein YqfD [Bacilli bacterium]|nr:sporulation protein YqfD [Bacilli bacterium]
MIELFTSKVHLNIKGKNINRFIKKLRSYKISVLSIKYKNKNEASIIIYKKDYEKLLKIKSIYDVTELDVFGLLKIKKVVLKNRHILFFVILCFIFLLTLTNLIFKVDIIHSNKDIRNLLNSELKKNGIKRLSFKKSYDSLSKIKEKILNKYPDKIEWLEIEEFGTKYIVRAEERKIPNDKIDDAPRNIIAKKPGMIKKVIAKRGDIVKDMDDYVEKGELIISGDLIFNNEVKGKVRSDGKVYAEIWYTTKTSYPLVIDKKKLTKNKKKVYALKFLNKTFELSFNKYKHKKIKEEEILKSAILPISLVRQSQNEIEVTNEILTYDEALERAKSESIKEIKKGLNKDEYIIRNAYLKSRENNSTIEVEMFFAVYEDITDYQEIGD